jgi:hypothetical protein
VRKGKPIRRDTMISQIIKKQGIIGYLGKKYGKQKFKKNVT